MKLIGGGAVLQSQLIRNRVESDYGDECWIWQGGCTNEGYPVVQYEGRQQMVTRIAYSLRYGPILEGHVIHHRECFSPPCWNPRHLQAVTRAENLLKGPVHSEVVCSNGHLRSENTWYQPSKTRSGGERTKAYCHQCQKDAARKSMQALRKRRAVANGVP